MTNLLGYYFSLTMGDFGKKTITSYSKEAHFSEFIKTKYLGNVAGIITSGFGTLLTYPF